MSDSYKIKQVDAEVVAFFKDVDGKIPDLLVTEINNIPGALRQTRILSIVYYATEARWCVVCANQRDYSFVPSRFRELEDLYTAILEHQQLLPMIFQVESRLSELFLKYLQFKDRETLSQIDDVLRGFFDASGYSSLDNILTVFEIPNFGINQFKSYDGGSGVPFARSLEATVTSRPEFSDALKHFGIDSADAVKIHVALLVAAHCYFMEQVRFHHPSFIPMAIFHSMSDETKQLLVGSSLRNLSPLEAFPVQEVRRTIVGVFLGPDYIDSSELLISPEMLFGMMLSGYYPNFMEAFAIARKAQAPAAAAPYVEPMVIVTCVIGVALGNFESVTEELYAGLNSVSNAIIQTINQILVSPAFNQKINSG